MEEPGVKETAGAGELDKYTLEKQTTIEKHAAQKQMSMDKHTAEVTRSKMEDKSSQNSRWIRKKANCDAAGANVAGWPSIHCTILQGKFSGVNHTKLFQTDGCRFRFRWS